MDYERIYNAIIKKRRHFSPEGYVERHHITPVSFGGNDEESNIVSLTAREHFLCHLLLVKRFEKTDFFYKALHAFMMMAVSSKNQNRITSRIFEKYREERAILMHHAQSGEKNSQFGTIWITNGSQNRKIKKDEQTPEGWRFGRKMGKISVKRASKPLSESQRNKISNSLKGRQTSVETREKLSKAGLGRLHREESKIKMSLAKIGKPRSEETKRKISEARKKQELSKKTFLDCQPIIVPIR